MEYVTGDAKSANSGWRVVKNVAGYDIHKLLIGSFGTLAVITAVNFRTFPLPRATSTFLLDFPDAATVLMFRRALAESTLQPRGVEFISPEAARLMCEHDSAARMPQLSEKAWTAVVSVGGNEGVVERHRKDLRALGDTARLEAFREHAGEEERSIWAWIARDLTGSVNEPANAVIRFSAVPSAFPGVLELAQRVAETNRVPVAAQVRAAGLVFVSVGCGLGGADDLPRTAAACNALVAQAPRASAAAVVYSCVPELVPQMNVWGVAGGDVELMRKLKQVFDPGNILSPGRFYGGI